MPELPEVERERRLAERTLAGKGIAQVHAWEDEIVFPEDDPHEIEEALEGATVVEARRRGKYLWLALDRTPWPLIHFGMTGRLRVPGVEPEPLASGSAGSDSDDRWPPRYAKLRIVAGDGAELVVTNARRLGRIRLREDPLAEPPVSELGFDPLLDLPGPEAFRKLVTRRRAKLKSLLLDQGFAAGSGNWIADEVLYQAGLDPRRRASDLSVDEIEELRKALEHVVETAVRVDAEKSRFPDDWLFHRRWGRDETATSAEGHPVEHLRISGRTTAWVPSVQR